MRATVLLNRGGGAAAADPAIGKTVTRALHEAGIDANVAMMDGGDIEAAAKASVRRGDPVLIVGGGDGTISAAASALAGSKTALGILPLGTLNHFARDLGLPLDIGEAAMAIARGQERKVDVAEMNGRIFINNSAIGLYPMMVFDRDNQRRRLGRSKRLAMLVASARTLLRFHHQRLALTINDRERRIDTPLLFVGNNDYTLEFPSVGQRESVSDGKLCVLVLRSKSAPGFLAATARALFGRTRSDDMVRIDDVRELRVDSARSMLAVSLDGETCRLPPPLDYRIRKGALKVIAPA